MTSPVSPKSQSFIFDDQPIGQTEDDLLWSDQSTLYAHIDDIAERIVASLVGPADQVTGSNSLTFAVHGPWGSGKTSFVRLILHKARLLAGNRHHRLLTCFYFASASEGAGTDAKSSLAMEILTTLGGTAKRAGISPKREAIRIFDKYADHLSDDKLDQDVDVSERLQEISRRLAQLPNFADLIEPELSGHGIILPGESKVLIVVIDDLDRCSSSYVSSILETIQRWSSVNNVFFIVAIDRDVLSRSLHETYRARDLVGDAYVALEKYVQYGVDIPVLSDDELATYIQRLLKGREQGAQVFKVLTTHADLLAKGIRVRTPRGIKRCINTIRPLLERRLQNTPEEGSTNDDTLGAIQTSLDGAKDTFTSRASRTALKELLLQYSWRDFYNTYYIPAMGDWSIASLALVAIELICSLFEENRDVEEYEFSVGRIQKRFSRPSQDITIERELAHFLSAEPWFILTRDIRAGGLSGVLAGVGRRPDADQLSGQPVHPAPDVPPRIFDPSVEPPIRKIERLHQTARSERQRGNWQAVYLCITEAIQLLREKPNSLSPDEVADVGNLALYTEALADVTEQPEIQQMALFMFVQAYRLDPNHANNNLNFVSFILDASRPPLREYYDEALQILGDDPGPYEREGYLRRWLLYKARLASLNPNDEPSWEKYVAEMLATLEREPGQEQFSSIVNFFTRVPSADRKMLRAAARVYIPHVSGQERNRALLVYADALGRANLNERMEIYRYLVRPVEEGGIEGTKRIEYRGNALHNYAVDLDNNDYLAEAGRRWYESYQIMGKEGRGGNLNRAYAAYLRDECDREDLAERVLAGEDINECAVAAGGRPIPPMFVEGGISALDLF